MNWWRRRSPRASVWKGPWKWKTLSVSAREGSLVAAGSGRLSSMVPESPALRLGLLKTGNECVYLNRTAADAARWGREWNIESQKQSVLYPGMELVQRLSRSSSQGTGVATNFPGKAVHQHVGGRLRSQAPTGTVLSSFGLRSLITSADQDRDSEETKELPIAMQPGETQTSGLQAQGSLSQNSF